MIRLSPLVSLLMLPVLLYGCTSRVLTFSVITTKLVEIDESTLQTAKRVSAESCRHGAGFVPTGAVTGPDISEALEATLEREHADLLVEAQIEGRKHTTLLFVIVTSTECTTVSGYLARIKPLAGSAPIEH